MGYTSTQARYCWQHLRAVQMITVQVQRTTQSTMMYRAYIGYAWVNRILVGRDRLFIGSLLQNALHIAYISVNYV